MISFGQLVVLLLLALLLFGDVRKIFKKFLLVFVNLKTLYKKPDPTKKEENKNE